jgi:ribonucleoside-diphosphate reductase alpha chain
MWDNKTHYNGLSVLPYDGGTYTQAPFEDIDKETYERLMKPLSTVDLSKIVEEEDETDLKGELACAGGACEIV